MFAAQRIPYQQTGAFTKIVLDYLEGANSLTSFYKSRPTLDGIKQAIELKGGQAIDRNRLVQALTEQYATVEPVEIVSRQIALLEKGSTFTICTAHQPNLFTGPLYFIYKILHDIKLANELKQQLPHYDFVPVYYMGSEDADLAELNHFNVDGKRYEWTTAQTGAVGRMVVDKALVALINELEGQVAVYPFGKEWIDLLRTSFTLGSTIQQATFQLVHRLFASYGLLVLIADQPVLKETMRKVFEEDLLQHTPSQIVTATGARLREHYDEQAHARDINLFYLKDNVRERIERSGDAFVVCNTDIVFTKDAIIAELQQHPERFSPNVILRGLYQETILPNIAFIGGGGEIAYWLQLKDLFDHYKVPFPVLVFRNSFMLLEKSWMDRIQKLGLSVESVFQPGASIFSTLVQQQTTHDLTLNGKLENASVLYDSILEQAQQIDPTLTQHVAALKTRALDHLKKVEKKMLRAEKRKFTEQQRQVEAIKAKLFPKNGLQERVDNMGYYYAKWGRELVNALYEHSQGLDQSFTVVIANN